MSINIGSGLIKIETDWTNFKSIASDKSLSVQYEESSDFYEIFGIDLPIVYYTLIYRGTVPPESGISQGQNDIDEAEFETNFKPFANKPISPKSNVSLGYTTSSGSALTVMRATAYTEQTTNAQRSVLSSSANDTSAGTGARTVLITYYDEDMLGPFTETITMNGTSAVNTVATNICFIEKIEIATVGGSLSNVGTITLKAATAGGGATIGTIPPGDGITNWCHHYVGLNKVMSLVSVIGTIKGPYNGAMEVHKTVPTNSVITELTIAPKIRIFSGSSDKMIFDVPIRIVGPALVTVYGRSDASSGTLDWSVGMGYYEG